LIDEIGEIYYRKEVYIMKRRRDNLNDEPTLAEGMDTEDELNKSATPEEIEKGEYTSVTTLSWDENDPS
jgi:hypothetical protein